MFFDDFFELAPPTSQFVPPMLQVWPRGHGGRPPQVSLMVFTKASNLRDDGRSIVILMSRGTQPVIAVVQRLPQPTRCMAGPPNFRQHGQPADISRHPASSKLGTQETLCHLDKYRRKLNPNCAPTSGGRLPSQSAVFAKGSNSLS